VDIIARATSVFDELIVAVLVNPEKLPLFSVEERVAMIQKTYRRNRRVRVDTFSGLLVDYAAKVGAKVIVRGLRAISDFEFEFQMALMNRRLNPNIETVFMMPAESYSYLSSRLVKEIFQLGGGVAGLVPAVVEGRLSAAFGAGAERPSRRRPRKR
jgi:pantetheine-phosphate adenylyltransferase